MKILSVIFNLNKGGTQRAAQNFCEAYSLLGHDSKMLALYEGGPRKSELENEGLQVWVGLSSKTKKEISSWEPDIVHVHSLSLKEEDVYSLKSLLIKAIFVETNVFSIPSKYSDVLKYSYQLSEWCRYLYLARGGKKNKCVIVPYPVKVKNFFRTSKEECNSFKAKNGIPSNAFLFGRIGQNYYDKWSLYLIDVFEKFLKEEDKNAYLVVVNPPKEIIKYVSDKSLTDNVIIIDKINSDEELRECYSSIDLFIHIANQGESFGLVLTESLLCETPVVTLNTPWGDNAQSEVIGNKIGGLSANSVDELYAQMKKLYYDRDLKRKLGVNGRNHILKNYDYLTVAQKSIDLIEPRLEPKDLSIPLFPSTLIGVKELKSFLKPIVVSLLWVKLHNTKSHKIVNFFLKKLSNFDSRKQFRISSLKQ